MVTEYKGLKVVEHGGAWVGFRAAIVRFPEQRFSVVILANLDAIDPSGLAFKVADIYLAGQLKEPEKKDGGRAETKGGKAYAASKAELEALAGNWQDDKFGLWLTVAMKDGRLTAGTMGRNFGLEAVGPGRFVVPGNTMGITVEFAKDAAGKPATAQMTVGKSQEFRFKRAEAVKTLDAAGLAEYAGNYVSEELLDANYKVSVEMDGLVMKTRDVPRAELKAMAPDKFTMPGFGLNVEFMRGDGGKVMGFTVSVGRAGGIEFVKR